MYELLVLSRLMNGPEHGYQIAKIANDIFGPWTKVSLGTLYPLLTKLEQAGLIRVHNSEQSMPRDGRQSRTYQITELGRMRLHQLMMDTTLNLGDYQRVFHLKVPHLEFLEHRERLHLLDHYINYCEARILHIQSETRDILRVASDSRASHRFSPTFLAAVTNLMQHQAEQWQGEVNWVKCFREQVVASIEADEQLISANNQKGEDMLEE
jgi:DNA-binding PadR family transcriptional regulator